MDVPSSEHGVLQSQDVCWLAAMLLRKLFDWQTVP